MINNDFDLTLTEISKWESNITLPVTTKLIEVLIRNENGGWETACNELTDLELAENMDHWGYGLGAALGFSFTDDEFPQFMRRPLTQLSPVKYPEPGTPIICLYRHPETKSTKVTGLIYDGHGSPYLIKII